MVYALSVKPSFGGLEKLKMHSEVRQQIKNGIFNRTSDNFKSAEKKKDYFLQLNFFNSDGSINN